MGFADGGDSRSRTTQSQVQFTASDDIDSTGGAVINLGAPGSGQVFNSPFNNVEGKNLIGGQGTGGILGGGGEAGGGGLQSGVTNVLEATVNLSSAEGAAALRDAAALIETQAENSVGFLDESLDFASDQFGRVLDFADSFSGQVSANVANAVSQGVAAGSGNPTIIANDGIEPKNLLLAAGLIGAAIVAVMVLNR